MRTLRAFAHSLPSLLLLSLVVAFVTNAQCQTTTNPLNFADNYFVTGDYVVRGVGLKGLGVGGYASQSIPGNDSNQAGGGQVPVGADIVEAFLYWQTVESSQTSYAGQNGWFNNHPISGVILGAQNAPVSWSSGGCTGSNSGSKTIRTYRASVRALMNVDAASGIVKANDSYTVKLVDSGSNGSTTPFTLGATLVIIYRVMTPNIPLSAIVLYDGSFAPSNAADTISQTLQGFYQPTLTGTVAKLTHVVGNGQPNKYETVSLNGTALPSPYGSSTPPFPGKYGGVWDNTTFDVSSVLNAPPNESSETTVVTPSPSNSGCVSWGATIFRTTVQDSDKDGLLDNWEANQGYYDIPSGAWIALPGANVNKRDIFVQLDYMCSMVKSDGTCDTTNGHSHLPPASALTMMTNAYAAQNIALHVDVRNAIQEETCTDNGSQLCPYPGESGVVTWKAGYTFLKNQPLNYPDEASCQAATTPACIRRFSHGRKLSYHYALFAHALGVPNWTLQDGNLTNVSVMNNLATFTTSSAHHLSTGDRVSVSDAFSDPNLNGVFTVTVPSDTTFTIPVTTTDGSYNQSTDPYLSVWPSHTGTSSGRSDVGGQDTLVTLGRWGADGFSVNVNAGTFFHELGHTLTLTHGGFYFDQAGTYVPTVEPNCKPNYQSVMSYMFQVDLLGDGVLDYSGQKLNSLSEIALSSTPGVTIAGGTPAIATTDWYAPTPQYGIGSAATHHCDGTPLLSSDLPMFRWIGATSPISWSDNQDINFDGKLSNGTYPLRGYDDWANLDLRQLGASGSASVAGGVSFAGGGGVSFAGGGGVSFAGGGGVSFAGGGGVSFAGGGGVSFAGGGGVGNGDLTYEVANSVVRPPKLISVVYTPQHSLLLTWSAPSFGQINTYNIYRGINGTAPTLYMPGLPNSPTSYNDVNVTCGPTYQYFVTAVLADGRESSPSNSISSKACPPPYTFTGFYSPMATAGDSSNSGTFNLGKSVTAKWTLQDSNGNIVTNLNANKIFALPVNAVNGACPLPGQLPSYQDSPSSYPGAINLYSPTSGAKGGSTFRISSSGNQFIFNWDTSQVSAGCYVFEVDLDSGQKPPRTSLKLK